MIFNVGFFLCVCVCVCETDYIADANATQDDANSFQYRFETDESACKIAYLCYNALFFTSMCNCHIDV